jgi:signal transduction histidine kinase/DNA-binding response OmpR family regulator
MLKQMLLQKVQGLYQKPLAALAGFRQDEVRVIRYFTIFFAAFLTVFIFFSIISNLLSIRTRAFDYALSAAEVAFKKDIIYRDWNSSFGGVYVPGEGVDHNLFLPQKDRSILNGRYVLINPSHMLRMAHGSGREGGSFSTRMVDIDPIRPENKADEWERAALIRFEKREAAYAAEIIKNPAGERIFRYIAPMRVDKSCMSCHAQHAYLEGSYKGGISSSFSFEPYVKKAAGAMNQIIVTYIIVWIIVLTFLYFAAQYLILNVNKKNAAILSAMEANRAKSIFFLKITHAISTPLNAIIGLSEVELRKKHSAETSNNLREINRSGSSILTLVDDVLDISMIQSGKFTIHSKNYDIAALISTSANENIVRIGRLPITFEVYADPSLPRRVRGDDRRIKQVLDKLLFNAFKHTKSGKVGFHLQKVQEDEFNIGLKFSISDTGSGIEPSKLSSIFSPKLNSYKIEESDLSLSICKEIIVKMGGDITVESTLNKGSLFSFTISQKIADNTPIGHELSKQLASFTYQENVVPEISSIDIIKMPYARVLAVDDVPTNLEVVKGLLAPYEIAVDCASTVDDMLERLRNSNIQYNAVFLDYMMPGVDGVEAFNLIRAEPSEYAKTVPVVALTAYSVKGAKEYFLQAGFSDYLTKPINIVELNQVLNNWVRDAEQEISYKPIAVSNQETLKKHEKGEISELLHIDIADLDVKRGITLFGAVEYIKILRSFASNTPKLLEKIMNVELSTLTDYAVVLHGIKGACYGISAAELAGFAGRLELLAKGGNFKEVNEGNKVFLDRLNTLISSINAFLEHTDALKESKARLIHPDEKILAALYESCLLFDISAMEEYIAKLDENEYEQGGEIVIWLRHQLDNLEYESIIERLAAYLGKK